MIGDVAKLPDDEPIGVAVALSMSRLDRNIVVELIRRLETERAEYTLIRLNSTERAVIYSNAREEEHRTRAIVILRRIVMADRRARDRREARRARRGEG